MGPILSIIIVNWNGEKFLPDCLRSIAENPPSLSYEVVVVDNASTDGSVAWLKSPAAGQMGMRNNFRLIESKENLGFGRGNNLAIGETDSSYIFVLNPDTMISAGTIDSLLDSFRDDEKIALAVPKVLGSDGLIQGNVWAVPTATKYLIDGLGIADLLPKRLVGEWLLGRHWTYDRKLEVPLASGCAMMLKRKVINRIGGFDPRIFMYGEDGELCSRIRKNGWKIVFDPAAKLTHIGGRSSSQKWDLITLRMKEEEGLLKVQEIILSPLQMFRLAITRLAVLSLRWSFRAVLRKDTRFLKGVIRLQLTGIKTAAMRIFSEVREPSGQV